MESRDYSYYDRRAQDVKLEDITSSAQNAEILRRLRDDLALMEGEGDGLIIADCDVNDENTFIVKERDDWGWLGYFIGRSKQIRLLSLQNIPEEEDEIDAFMKCINHNRSIEDISVGGVIKGGSITKHLTPFIMHNSNLKQLLFEEVDIDFDSARTLAMALSQRHEKSLTAIYLCHNNLSNEALEEIIDALSGYKQLKTLFVNEDLAERDEKYYEMLAPIIDLSYITSSKKNTEILRKLRDNVWKKRQALTVGGYDYDEDEGFFCSAEEENDWGWVGYFIGRSSQIRDLHLYYLPEEEEGAEAFMKGMSCNRSIKRLELFRVNGGDSFIESLAPFIMDNSNLKQLLFEEVDIGLDCAHSLAKALNGRQQKSLTMVSLCRNNLSNDALAEIIDALSGYKQLKTLFVNEDLAERDEKYYAMLAPIIDLKRITSSKKNAEILRKLRDDEWNEKKALTVRGRYKFIHDVDDGIFSAREKDDWGWLAYFIDRNKKIRDLHLNYLPKEDDDVDAFMMGLNRSRSIELLQSVRGDIDLGRLSSFIINNSNLKDIRFDYIEIGLESAHCLAMALDQRQEKSLSRFFLRHNNLSNDALAEITAALSTYTSLETFSISENPLIGRGCVSLGSVIRSAALHLKEIFLDKNDCNDEDMPILTAALTNAANLRQLSLSGNRSITATGLRELSRVFHSDCPLETLFLEGMNIGDVGAEALADGLMGNTTLKHLVFSPDSAGITSIGWSAFSRLLCDTSSINNTYRSNHTLEHIGDYYDYEVNLDRSLTFHSDGFYGVPSAVVRWMEINITSERAAKIKIGMCHPDIPVEVFFQHKLKFLPLLASWFAGFEKGDLPHFSPNYRDCQKEYQKRELSAVYKFIRAIPVPAGDGQMSLKSSCGRKRKYDE